MDTETADRLSDQEAFNLIFHPGFSTKDQISDVSGRGMDVVKTGSASFNGTIDVKSEKYRYRIAGSRYRSRWQSCRTLR
ncbi:MAG: hypothetical protein R3F47_01695 [Gammaproteobacteria bacterium]